MIPLLLALACGPKSTAPSAPTDAATNFRSTMPAPLPARPFVMPTPAKATLSNGIPVVVVENHETPLVYARMVFRAGAASDPHPGVAYVTLDMMNEGAADMTAEELSAATKKLATNLGAAARIDSSEVGMSCLKANLAPSLDLMAAVVKEPTFPKSEWTIVRQQHLQDLETARDNPNSVAERVFDAVTWSGGYIGNLPTAKHYQSMTVGDMKKWYDRFVAPQNAILLIGGDTTLAEIQPLLEARFGTWKKPGAVVPGKPDVALRHVESATTVYLVDRPGAAQSVLQVGVFVGDRSDREAYYAKKIADVAIAGMFTSRVNLNLREDKGYTYGAGGSTMYDMLDGRWEATTGVRTDATVPALKELLSEVGAPAADRPFTQAELEAARGYWLGTYPLRFESPDFFLEQVAEQWLYGLPEDWVTAMPTGVQAVNVDAMNAVWKDRVRANQVTVVVVGDKSAIGTDLAALGYPVIDVDPDGKPLKN
jgi:zinc protease